jgi:phosphoenolpyruvate carboxykinase (GTP)
MLPFCGYNMGDYFEHWLEMGAALARPPRVFRVNWFRTDDRGKLLWPGYGENLRVLKWILERCEGGGDAVETPIGLVPTMNGVDRTGLDVTDETLSTLLKVDPAEWVEAVEGQDNFLASLGARLPQPIRDEHVALAHRIHDVITPPDLRGRYR